MNKLRNLLLASGAYYLPMFFLYGPLVVAWSYVSNRLSFVVGLESVIVMPVVLGAPKLVIAGAVGAIVSLLAEARYPSRWALVPAGLFSLQSLFAQREWAQPPELHDRASMLVEAALPVVACLVTATIAERWSKQPPPDQALHPTADSDSPVGPA